MGSPDAHTAMTAVNVIIDKLKRLRELNEKLKNVEVNTILSELQLAVADVKLELANERDKNVNLQNEIRELKRQLDLMHTVEFKNNFVFTRVGDRVEGPYCPRCYGRGQKLVRLVEASEDAYGCALCQFVLRRDGHGLDGNRRAYLTNAYLK
jgi:tetrahydromethanopterin S-methyltransferase subunit G